MRVEITAVVPVTVTVVGIPKTVLVLPLTTTIVIRLAEVGLLLLVGVGLLDTHGVDLFLGLDVLGRLFQSARVGQDIRHPARRQEPKPVRRPEPKPLLARTLAAH